MPSKNSLASIKQPPKEQGDYKPVLPANTDSGAGEGIAEAQPAKTPRARKKIGRPPKEKAEKRDYKITLSLTQEQGRAIKKKAGIAGEATYLYDQLLQAGVIK